MILIISAVFPPEPVVAASLSNDLAETLSENNKVVVITAKPSRPLGFNFRESGSRNLNFEHIVLDSYTYPGPGLVGRCRESYSFGRQASKYIRRHHRDIRCCYITTWPLIGQYLIIKTLKEYSIRSLVHVQDIYPESLFDKLRIFKRLVVGSLLPIDKYVLKNTSKVITISPKMKSYLVRTRRIREDMVEVVYNWQDETAFIDHDNSRVNKQGSDSFTFMFLGCLNLTAAVDNIIRAFYASGLKNSRLVIAGSGSQKDPLITLAGTYPDLNIEFWDAEKKDVPALQEKADVLILNLRKGNAMFALPSKLAAYMFSKKPVIASVDDESGTASAIREAGCGWVVPPENIEALAVLMKNVTTIDRDELIKLGKNGFDYALKNYSRKHNLEKLASLVIQTAWLG